LHIQLGKGEEGSGGREKPRLLASAFEALIGAIYLDGGFEPSFQFIENQFQTALQNIDLENHFTTDYKTRLQEKFQEQFKETPVYKVIKEEGPDHGKTFHVQLLKNGECFTEGSGKSKKQAEQAAAELALQKLKEQENL
jgi:ribonuclease-3